MKTRAPGTTCRSTTATDDILHVVSRARGEVARLMSRGKRPVGMSYIFSHFHSKSHRGIFFFPWQKTRHCIVQRAGFDSRTRRVLLGINSPPRAVGRYPSASAMADRDGSKDFYQVKRVSFLGRKDVPIICQNENGPCPLLAIANVLLLRNAIALQGSPDRSEVSTAELMSLLAARLLDVNDKATSRDEMVRQNQEQNLNDAMAVLPTLATGLDVNVRFRHPLDFEFTAELAVFDLLDVTLCHAWVAGPEHAAARDAIGARSYNQLMERLVELATAEEASSLLPSAPTTSATRTRPREKRDASEASEEDAALRAALALSLDDAETETPETPTSPTSRAASAALREAAAEASAEIDDGAGTSGVEPRRSADADADAVREARRHERVVLDAFLESSASQLTPDGMRDARDAVKERELAVFFRNNHFATVFKLDGALYLLVTDQGYLRERDVVWETLCEAERPNPNAAREGAFANAAFAPFAPRADPAARRSDERDARMAAALLASAAETSRHREHGARVRDDADAIPATFLRAGGSGANDAEARSGGGGASSDADHALAVALQAEFEEEREREEAAARARRAEATAATRPPPPPPPPPRRRTGEGTSSSRRGALPPRSKKSCYSSDCVVM